MKGFSAVILAAGDGTRMKSSLPKVVHKLSGKPLINWVIDSLLPLKPDNIVLVLGRQSELVEKALGALLKEPSVKTAYQKERKGSAHALMQAQKTLKNYRGQILVLSGDVPLIKSETLKGLLKSNAKKGEAVTVLGATAQEPYGYGRIIKNGSSLEKIVEEKDASPEQKEIKEINGGIYCFSADIWKALSKIKPDNAKKEYYLTDAVEILKNSGKKAGFVLADGGYEVKGINSRAELAQAEQYVNALKIKSLLDSGVTVIAPNSVYVSSDAKIGQDSVLYPNVFIDSNVEIGKNCIIRGSSYIINSKIADNAEISYSYINGAVIGKNVKAGPFSHIRPHSVLKDGVKVGNFSEIKKSVVEKNAKINHLSYIGDAFIGQDVNIGAGAITCNYDGVKKHATFIGAKSFIGSNVNFVAPVKVGKDVLVAAGSTITKDIPSGKLAIARARQELKRKKTIKN
ncbi:MAG: bifunctional UDP-N-acetylglucosamine diphosphorylase/glucosamine-1-phosphate N-acetyltransferase GlmU [Endomicrobium sp.]|jgi:bifunctional UDP-N-acetylglucosamine pyrophosphorylase/glucosamine-1-phosphate N-acetyltransferase|nr:bifunctional UDP-N-acetylglucosamine diphosphorylase/glucosamine-1-phosphate N-acetyltransferase GlmU [Endomicrobium sp.]